MLPERGLYHTCFSVADLNKARADLGDAFDLTWTAIREAPVRIESAAGEVEDLTIHFCYSVQGPPYIELIQGPPGHPYFATSGDGHVHHVGLFVDNLPEAMAQYESAGFPRQFATIGPDGAPQGISYHHNPYGASIELVSSEVRAFVQGMIQEADTD